MWISNPRSDRKLLAYNFGVEAVKELIGSLEDVRRFDFAILVVSGEVPRKVINLSEDERPKVKHTHTSDLCRDLVLWGWSRSPDQTVFEKEAVKAILEYASIMGEKYVSNIPLVEAADQRLKIARLAVAMAVRTFSHVEGDSEIVLVRTCHVEAVVSFMQDQYDKHTFGYLDYSRMIKSENEVRDEDQIKVRLNQLNYAKDVVKALLETNSFTAYDVSDWTEYSLDEARSFMGFLVRKNAVKRARRGYVKTTAFIALLKSLEIESLPEGEYKEEGEDEI